MATFEITYMVDPGDGIESKATFEHENDDMIDALCIWQRVHGNPYFITGCIITEHPLMEEDNE